VSIQLLTPPGAGPADGYRELAGTIQARSAWAQARATGAR
jgi:hypothetical protein